MGTCFYNTDASRFHRRISNHITFSVLHNSMSSHTTEKMSVCISVYALPVSTCVFYGYCSFPPKQSQLEIVIYPLARWHLPYDGLETCVECIWGEGARVLRDTTTVGGFKPVTCGLKIQVLNHLINSLLCCY